jgi:hypothetical protein
MSTTGQLTAEDKQLRLVVFQIIMTLVGGLAYWNVQIRNAGNLSLINERTTWCVSFI